MSDRNLAILVRQLALHCNLAAQIQKTLGSGHNPYSSNWLERLRQIKRIKEKLNAASAAAASDEDKRGGGAPTSKTALNDFTATVLRRISRED